MTTPPDAPTSRHRVDILSVESRRLLGGGWVTVDAESGAARLNTPFGADRADVLLQFESGGIREVTLTPQASADPYEYAISWRGDDPLVPEDAPRGD